MIIERTHGLRDRHVVVVQDHEQVGLHGAGVVQRFECHACRHRAVANHRDDPPPFALALRRDRHAERSRNRRRRMRGAERVVFAFGPARKSGGTAGHPQAAHRFAASGQDLVRIRLVADVEHEAVARRVEYVMQCNGQLDRAEVGAQMAAGLGDALQHIGAKLVGQLLQLGARQAAQVGGAVDGAQQGIVHDEALQLSRSTTESASRLRWLTSARPLAASAALASARSCWASDRAASRPSTLT